MNKKSENEEKRTKRKSRMRSKIVDGEEVEQEDKTERMLEREKKRRRRK